MATSTYLLSTVMMSVLVLGVAFVLARGRAWRQYRPQLFGPDADVDLTSDPFALAVGFILLLGVSLVVTLFAAGGGSIAIFLAVAGAIVVGFLLAGIYSTARSNGHARSYAVGETVLILGGILLVTIVGWLLMTAGA
jgi:FtsH-binding integral membrane protein